MLKYMTVEDALKAVNGTWVGATDNTSKRITEVVTDSRKAAEGICFVALPGERVDGHDFVNQVLEAGAVCSIVQKNMELSDELLQKAGYILVEDTRTALRDLAAYYRSILDIKVVGITGSVGKTSTKEMIATVLGEKYKTQKTAGNFNNEIGLPLTVFSITEEHEVAVLEMGISDFGEMERLARIARPDIMVITNIGQCHLENLGTRDGILKAKTECFDYLNENARVVLNGKDDKLCTVELVQGQKPYFYGVSDEACGIEDKSIFSLASCVKDKGLAGSEAVISVNNESMEVSIPVAGAHMVINASAAAAVGALMGMNLSEIAAGISHCSAVAGRGKLIQTSKYLLVDDTYNANPVSMRAELDLLAKTQGRRVAILGDMFELGTEEKKMHFDLGGYAVSRCDVLICIGALSKEMFNGANGLISDNSFAGSLILKWYATKEDFLSEKDMVLQNEDTILLKASHGMEFSKILDLLQK